MHVFTCAAQACAQDARGTGLYSAYTSRITLPSIPQDDVDAVDSSANGNAVPLPRKMVTNIRNVLAQGHSVLLQCVDRAVLFPSRECVMLHSVLLGPQN